MTILQMSLSRVWKSGCILCSKVFSLKHLLPHIEILSGRAVNAAEQKFSLKCSRISLYKIYEHFITSQTCFFEVFWWEGISFECDHRYLQYSWICNLPILICKMLIHYRYLTVASFKVLFHKVNLSAAWRKKFSNKNLSLKC